MFTLTADASMLSMVNIILAVSTILAATDTTVARFWHQWRANPENVAYSKKRRIGVSYFTIAENHFNQPNYRMDSLDADETASVIAE